jgi:hypothetical protein
MCCLWQVDAFNRALRAIGVGYQCRTQRDTTQAAPSDRMYMGFGDSVKYEDVKLKGWEVRLIVRCIAEQGMLCPIFSEMDAAQRPAHQAQHYISICQVGCEPSINGSPAFGHDLGIAQLLICAGHEAQPVTWQMISYPRLVS